MTCENRGYPTIEEAEALLCEGNGLTPARGAITPAWRGYAPRG